METGPIGNDPRMEGAAGTESAARENYAEAKQAAMDAYADLIDAKRKFAQAARSAGVEAKESTYEHLEEAAARAQAKKDQLHELSEEYMHKNPLAVAGILFATGFIVSRIMSK